MRKHDWVSMVVVLACVAVAAPRILGQSKATAGTNTQAQAASESTVKAGSQKAQAGANSAANSSEQSNLNPSAKPLDLNSGTKISAALVSTVDARTAKPGDQVAARVTKNVKQHGKVVIHKGDEIVGRVTEAQAGANSKAASHLAVSFDRVVEGGSTFQLNSVAHSVFSNDNTAAMQSLGADDMGGMGGGPTMAPDGGGPRGGLGSGGMGGAVGSAAGAAGSAVGSTANVAGSAVGGVTSKVDSNASGAVRGGAGTTAGAPWGSVHLSSGASSNQQASASSVFSTSHGDVRLDSGTRIEFRVSGQSETGSSTK